MALNYGSKARIMFTTMKCYADVTNGQYFHENISIEYIDKFSLLTLRQVDARGSVVAHSNATATARNATVTVAAPPLLLAAAELWSVGRPYLYTLVARVALAAAPRGAYDAVNTTVGVRRIVWDPAHGLMLNTEKIKMRGFCNHESFAGVGAAIPPRIDLFRVQQMRGVGGNAWRTSHNPPEPALLDVTDRLGVLVLDENRVFVRHLSHFTFHLPLTILPFQAPFPVLWSDATSQVCSSM